MNGELSAQIDAAADQYPHAAQLCREIVELSPTLLVSQIEYLIRHKGERFWQEAERLDVICRAVGGTPAKSLIDYTVVYLKEQAKYLATKEYSHTTFDSAFEQVYDNPDVMQAYYLDGLMMSHAFWPIHFDIHDFFRKEFLSRVPETGEGAEFGFGHGLYLVDVLQHAQRSRALGYDISRFSLAYAAKVLEFAKIDASRYRLQLGNVCEPLPLKENSLAWAICAEVMEHIPDPQFSFTQMGKCVAPGSPFFITTVVQSNAIDHMFLFNDVKEVDDLLDKCGLKIVAQSSFRVADYARASRDPSIDVALVCVRK